ncbi:MAG: hypothetical protein FJ247_14020, partial [Nitrospira sp.]|nr:hypothetical protein [Nitrospira sp.]
MKTHHPGAGFRRGPARQVSSITSVLSVISALALILFSSTSLASSVNYNLAGWPTGISSRVTIPPSWVPAANAPDYKGKLDVY